MFSEMLLPEFDQEMANTRKTLERIPEARFDWKPHEKSSSLGGLSTHLANIPSWTVYTFKQDELDIAPPGAPPFRLEEATTRDEVLEAFDKNVAAARAVWLAGSRIRSAASAGLRRHMQLGDFHAAFERFAHVVDG